MTPLAKQFSKLLPIEPTATGFYTWHNGYFVRVDGDQRNTGYTITMPLASLDGPTWEMVSARASELATDKRVKRAQLNGKVLEFFVAQKVFGGKEQPQMVLDFLTEQTDWLQQNQIHPGCFNCGLEGPHPVLKLHDLNQPMCQSCEHEYRESLRSELVTDDTGRNYASGIVGAILGSVVGVAIFFGVAHVTNRFFSLLAIVIGLLAVFLYRKFRGKLTVTGGILVALVTTVIAIIGYFTYIYFLLNQYYELTPLSYIQNLDVVLGLDGVVSDLVFYMLFVLLSVFVSMSGFIADVRKRRTTMEELGIETDKPDDVV